MFICQECGRRYEDEIAQRLDFDCSRCGGLLEETKRCSECGEYFTEDELIGGVCEKCIDSYRHDVNGCINVAREMPKEEIKINPLLAYLFDEKDIEAILIERVKERMSDVDCSEFIDNDITLFAEKITA